MSEEKIDFKRTTKPVSDADIVAVADEILALLTEFDSPKDAGSALTLAQFKMITKAFPPGFRKAAIEAVDASHELVKQLIAEGWQ
jgi:hypothetical protein